MTETDFTPRFHAAYARVHGTRPGEVPQSRYMRWIIKQWAEFRTLRPDLFDKHGSATVEAQEPVRAVARIVVGHHTHRTTQQDHPSTEEPSMAKAKAAPAPERAVIVTTEHRGVFFGYATETDGETITLARARLCVYWSADVRGFMGLAANGPSRGCRIGPPADITLRAITAVVEVTSDAAAKWEAAPWS